jgi:hypothetical protein
MDGSRPWADVRQVDQVADAVGVLPEDDQSVQTALTRPLPALLEPILVLRKRERKPAAINGHRDVSSQAPAAPPPPAAGSGAHPAKSGFRQAAHTGFQGEDPPAWDWAVRSTGFRGFDAEVT